MTEPTDNPRPLTPKQRAFVAAYIGEARGNATEAARLAGYKGAERTLISIGHENLTKPDIKRAVEDHLAEVKRRGIAYKQNRVDALVRRAELLELVIAERAAEYRALAEARRANQTPQSDLDTLLGRRSIPAGGETGLLVRKVKAVGDMIAEEFAVDTGLLAELRAHEADVAKELGERVDRQHVTGEMTTTVEFVGDAAEVL